MVRRVRYVYAYTSLCVQSEFEVNETSDVLQLLECFLTSNSVYTSLKRLNINIVKVNIPITAQQIV